MSDSCKNIICLNTEEKNLFSDRWVNYFMKIASVVAEQSKDPSTKVGAVIVSPNRQIISTGFNGFPVSVNDDPERYLDRPTKLKMVVHAEANAICQAAKHGIQIDGGSIFCTLVPCIDCAKLIIQSGIQIVYYRECASKTMLAFNAHDMICKVIDKYHAKYACSVCEAKDKEGDMPVVVISKHALNTILVERENAVDREHIDVFEAISTMFARAYPTDSFASYDFDKLWSISSFMSNPRMETLSFDRSCDHEWRDKINDSINLMKEAQLTLVEVKS